MFWGGQYRNEHAGRVNLMERPISIDWVRVAAIMGFRAGKMEPPPTTP